jgi:hypothetical protein
MREITDYLWKIKSARKIGNATDHTRRPTLELLLEATCKGAVATNDPQRIVCDTPTDFIISSKETPLGYIEAEDVGVDLARAEETVQFKRCRAIQRNIIGISLPLVFGLVIYGRLLFAADSMLSDPDTYWHIASGRWIIAHPFPHGRVSYLSVRSRARLGVSLMPKPFARRQFLWVQ